MSTRHSTATKRACAREDAVVNEIEKRLLPLLSQRGYSIQKLDLGGDSAADLRFALDQVRTAYQQASAQLYKKVRLPQDQRATIRASVGPVVNRLADHADADALLLVRGYGFEKTRGMAVKEVAAASLFAALLGANQVFVPAGAGLATELALLDGATGDVLWANWGRVNQAAGNVLWANWGLEAAVDDKTLTAVLKNFPSANQRRVAAAPAPAAAKPVPDAPVAQVVADVPALVPASSPSTARPAPPAPQLGRPVVAQAAAASVQPAAAKPPTPAMIIALAIDEDGRDWHPGSRDASVKGALIELVPQGHDIKAWSEMVALHTIFTPLAVADFVATWQGGLTAADPEAAYRQTAAADGSITVEYESVALREKGVRRFMRGADGLYMVAYHARPETVDQAVYAQWEHIIAGASLEANE